MKLTVSLLLLVAICHVAEVNSTRSQPSKEGEANPTVKRTLVGGPGYGLEGALYRRGLIPPGLEYSDPHHNHHYPGVHHDPHLAHAALAGLYGPLSPYHHLKLDYSPFGHLGYHHGHHSHHDKSDDDERDSSGEERESERPKSEKSSKKSKSKKSKRPSSKSSSRSEKNEEKHHSHHEHDDHKYAHLDYAHLAYPHGLLYPNHHLLPHLRAGLHYPYYHQQPYYQPHLGLGHPNPYNPYLQPLPYVQQSVEQQVIPGVQYTQDGQHQQVQQQVPQQIQQPGQQQQIIHQDANLQGAPSQQNPQAQAQSAVSYASYSQSLPQSYQPQIAQPAIQGQLYSPQLQVLQTQPLFQLLGVQPVNIQPAQLLVPSSVPQESLQSQPPNLFPESPQPVTQATLLQPIATQSTIQTTALISSPTEVTPVVTIRPTTLVTTASTTPVVEIQPPKRHESEVKREVDNSINSSRAYLSPLLSQMQEVVIGDPQLPAVSTIAPAFYGK
ncbi:hypothetical protein K1T71_008503 [Dendrolimus kikuchii]|uniref:Uncharacterized protein n=1 Tax=Dendrolimus kikuchii TaxID=765133 RepID=A0ACC1CX90_9NEOP|nr:hypothetical protein K1T71_008503 [Dendrolimus kikuchii]